MPPATDEPVKRFYLENAWPTAAGARYGGTYSVAQVQHRTAASGKEEHHFTITLQDAPIASVSGVVELGAPVQRQSATEEVAFCFQKIIWTNARAARAETMLLPRIGQRFRLLLNGRTRLEGTLKAARSLGAGGELCEVLISDARRH
ncbi:type VI secretion system tube protein Hcp [Vannielia litorea]|uniref:Type VI secretion system effector, Hcp n=1 Tax=Vannielia litorea TaxID=1217970 RepID=A0A1N6F5F6_9RHOB|nr:type VI secretion system tube protein Hcp [Vannielia litorea]SIN90497.1 Type VI secretion system effector, Hcp [Vannielia litorea]